MYLNNTAQPVRRHNKGHSLVSDQIVSVASLQEENAHLLSSWKKNDWRVHKELGTGGFGTVYLATYLKSNQKVAIKRMPHRTKKQRRKNYQEIRFLLYTRGHPNILEFQQATIPENSPGEMWLVTELIDGGTLTYAVAHHHFSEPEIAYVTSKLLNGLRFLHDHQLCHRDLKSANVMIGRDARIKIIDFGLCSDISQGEVVHMVGSPFWMPPEMIKKQPHGLPVDIWSFGICCMEMANGHPPHRKSSIKAMFVSCVTGYPEPFEDMTLWTEEFKDFVGCCIQREASSRWTVPQLQQHPFNSKKVSREAMSELCKKLFPPNYFF
eukprot:TRINITY_DN364_c0_g1_i9.p1 TRINITY_DN364_c0_g1~~TRINITY_DN364_c0_g1_i9.p1  ORF type:complete len:323 (-),score=50.45 TRINITY_DN364_c0_g1_i9:321-1289(-)